MKLAIDVGFADAAGDQLCVLGAKIKDKDFLMHIPTPRDSSELPW